MMENKFPKGNLFYLKNFKRGLFDKRCPCKRGKLKKGEIKNNFREKIVHMIDTNFIKDGCNGQK